MVDRLVDVKAFEYYFWSNFKLHYVLERERLDISMNITRNIYSIIFNMVFIGYSQSDPAYMCWTSFKQGMRVILGNSFFYTFM